MRRPFQTSTAFDNLDSSLFSFFFFSDFFLGGGGREGGGWGKEQQAIRMCNVFL